MNEITLRTIVAQQPLSNQESLHIKRLFNPVTKQPSLWLAKRSYYSVEVEWDYLIKISLDEAREIANTKINNTNIWCDNALLS